MTLLAGMVALAAAAGGGDLVAGPVAAGDGAAWATRTRSGAVRLVTKQPGGERVVRRRWAPPRDGRSDRAVPSLAADGRRLAAVVATCTMHRRFSPVLACTGRAFSGPFARVRGPRLPGHVPGRCRQSGRRNVLEVATGGGWTATLVERACPATGIESAARLWIEARGPRTRRIPLRVGRALALAGDYLAWADLSGVVLYDLRRGEPVRRLGDTRGPIGAHDVQSDGTLALTRWRRGQVCVSTVELGEPERDVACRYEEPTGGDGDAPGARTPAIAISAGRILYVSNATDLILQRPGGEPELITRFTPQRLRTGSIGLGPRTAVWAEQRTGAPRVVVKRL